MILKRAKKVGRLHKCCDCAQKFPRHSKRSALLTTFMALGWIIFCIMKTLVSYIILVGIFYQLLIQTFSFYSNIYLTMNNMIITTELITMFLPYIVRIINWYFKLINPYWLLNSKQQTCQILLKRYRKESYRQKLKIRNFFLTNNQLL